MHELSVVFHVIDQLEEVAKENDVKEIKTVTLQLGEVSAVLPWYLTDCWNWAKKKHEIMQDCEMKIEKIDAVTFCEDCKQTYETVKHGKTCPFCGSGNTFLVQGNEFMIKEIEAI
ncbi:MAG: hydrogenase maturation nickel metallochaperone HypA [Lachnospiraceae bacterium]|nr:hydrogenase maturation nickel metallochaperone HypA [Lachnospiraceae bacterium]